MATGESSVPTPVERGVVVSEEEASYGVGKVIYNASGVVQASPRDPVRLDEDVPQPSLRHSIESNHLVEPFDESQSSEFRLVIDRDDAKP